jgi:signal transduction histidine kinase
MALLKLYDVQEDVAKRIAHRLHDESAQMLAVVYLELADIARDASDATTARIGSVVTKLDEVCAQLRRLSHELRPLILDQLGLMAGLEFLAAGVRKRSGLVLNVTGGITGPLGKPAETVLYRVVQEALSNVVRHSRASTARVHLWEEHDRVHCSITDDGVGFLLPDRATVPLEGLGLVGIHERVAALKGSCRIFSQRGKGTELRVELPL